MLADAKIKLQSENENNFFLWRLVRKAEMENLIPK